MKHLLILLLLITIGHSQSRETVAVYPLSSNTIRSSSMTILTDNLRTSLVNTQTFSVVGRNDIMNDIVQEQALQQNGVFNEKRIVQIGNMTGADFLVSGSVEMYNGKHLYNISLTNIETGELVNSVSTDKYGTEFIAFSLADKSTVRHKDRQHRNQRESNGKGKIVTRALSGVIGATALFMSIHYGAKANEYKELQGVSNFYTNIDMSSEYTDYSNEIQKNETMMGVMLGVSGVSFAVCGITFLF